MFCNGYTLTLKHAFQQFRKMGFGFISTYGFHGIPP